MVELGAIGIVLVDVMETMFNKWLLAIEGVSCGRILHEQNMSELEKDLLKVLGALLSIFPLLFIIALIYKYPEIFGIIAVCTGFIIYWFYKTKNEKIILSQNTTIDRLNRISAEYKISPTPAITEALADDEFERLVGNIENKIVVTAASKVVARYKDVLCRKRRQMVFPDDYGREIRASWDNELEYFTRNVLIPELTVEISKHFLVVKAENLVGNADDRHTIDYWAKHTDPIVNYYLRAEPEQETDFDEFMSGHEYEHYVAELIRKHGWKAQVTPGSGDHGADIIAEKGRLRVAVQCKLYSSPVGNKSVQEAFSAQGFYDCQKSCVVTNSTYTNAARKAAWKLGVSLLHHEQVGEYLKGLK